MCVLEGEQMKDWTKRSVATFIHWFTLHTEVWHLQLVASYTASTL